MRGWLRVETGIDVTVLIEEVSNSTQLTDSPVWETLRNQNKLHVLENRSLTKSVRRGRVLKTLILGLPFALTITKEKLKENERLRPGTLILETWIKLVVSRTNTQYDLIHAQEGSTGRRIANLVDYNLLSAPYIVSVQGSDVCAYTPTELNRLYHKLFASCDRVLGATDYVLNHLRKTSIKPIRTTRLPATVNTKSLLSSREPRDISDEIRLLNVARMLKLKGQRYAIEALALLRSKGLNATLTIIGSGPEEAELKRLTQSLSLGGSVLFKGQLPHHDTLYEMERHDILLHPCCEANGQEEAMGLVMLEAQLKGMLCVVSDSGGAPETIIDGESGIIVPPQSPHAIAIAVESLVQQHGKWPEFIEAGRTHIKKMFGAETQGRKLVQIYKDTII